MKASYIGMIVMARFHVTYENNYKHMKRWMIMSMIAFGFLFMASCTSSNRAMQGGGYGYYDPMYYGPSGYYYNPGMYPRNNVIIQQNRVQPKKRLFAPRSNRRPATAAPQNQRGTNNRSTVQPNTRQKNAPSQMNRRSTTPGRRSTVAPQRNSSPSPSQRSAPTRSPSRSRGNN
ncbi:MAG TPA: hypothetical protein VK957_18850 [Lunatimonas sp.]|nr:hypothetical protein [Lunatimonas sp.]